MPQEQTVYRWNNIISLLPGDAGDDESATGTWPLVYFFCFLGFRGSEWLVGWLEGRPTANLRPKIEQFEIQSVARRRLLSTLHSPLMQANYSN